MSLETFATLIIVIGALIILLQAMAIIAWWRRGSKYGRMEIARRELIAQETLKVASRPSPSTPPTPFIDWNAQTDLDDSAHE